MKKRSKKPDNIRVCVKIPGRIKNVQKAIEMLGGEETLIKVSLIVRNNSCMQAITQVNSKIKNIKTHLKAAQLKKHEKILRAKVAEISDDTLIGGQTWATLRPMAMKENYDTLGWHVLLNAEEKKLLEAHRERQEMQGNMNELKAIVEKTEPAQEAKGRVAI